MKKEKIISEISFSRMMHKFIYFLLLICFLIKGLAAEIYYPWKNVYIGPLQNKTLAGLVMAVQPDCVFAFRIRVKKGDEFADGLDLYYLISEVGPYSPEGQYARIKFDLGLPFGKEKNTPILKKPSSKSDTLIFEWTRQDEKTVLGRIKIPKDIEIQLVHYFPWDMKGKYAILEDGCVRGESSKKYNYLLWTSPQGEIISYSKDEELAISFPREEGNKVYFVAGVGKELKILQNHIYRYKNKRTIDSFLEDEEERYRKKRVKVEGLYKGAAKAVTNNLFWTTLYQPGYHRLYTPAGRTWIYPDVDGIPEQWTIFEWDSFFNALLASVESSKHAKSILSSVLETQYQNGNIPNWRGLRGGSTDRSQPPVGSYVVLKIFLKTGDLELLRFAYPYLKKWHFFWKGKKINGTSRRDGNEDGFLEWGCDMELMSENILDGEKNGRQRAMWESGEDDLPNWDEASFDPSTGTLTMNCVDLNSLYALDSWCLAQIANILDKKEEKNFYIAEYENMRKAINDYFWDDKEGFYFDRHWNGTFSKRKAASNFYPLIAHIPDQKRAMRVLKHLLNPKEFWNDYVIPTISRDDPAYGDQQYWRGTIWPPTNYLVYQGLKAYGFDVVASEFAQKSSSLFLRTWKNFQICPENFDSRTGEAGGERYQSWGPLFTLIALEEYLDFNPWEGFRFGMITPEKKGKLSRIAIHGRHYDVKVSSSHIKLIEEGREILKANGSAIFRHFLYSENEVSFEIKSLEKRQVKIKFLTKGKYQLMIDNRVRKVFKGDSVKIKIPEGEHEVLILLLD